VLKKNGCVPKSRISSAERTMRDSACPSRSAIEAIWRIEAPRLLGGLVRIVRDVDLAEDLAQEALLTALEHWPDAGVPDNPGAWLMTTAKRRATDHRRRSAMMDGKHQWLASASPAWTTLDDEALDVPAVDDVLSLMLTACHPVLSKDARVALTLRLVAGLSTAEIARAFLTPEVTIAQRIVRAKRTLLEAKVPFEVPTGDALEARVLPTLEVVYLIFNEGYAATSGEAVLRPQLCDEALRLGRMLVELVPNDGEVHGLVALMELQASRARARVGARGEPVLLADQDRGQWDRLFITRGLNALGRAEACQRPLGPYALQAAIAACHAVAVHPDTTDWERIVALYDALVEVTGSPVVELNRAVAIAMAYGPEQGLLLVNELCEDPALRGYHWLHAARGDLLTRIARHSEASAEFEKAASLTQNQRERELLLARAAARDGIAR
jgi:RNA polymerase sigma-70 factor, ECF subfamily